MSESMALAIGF